jgi:LuxR family maltose regulon positive regulatory protein
MLPPRRCLPCLPKGDLAKAAHLAETHELPVSRARVHLAQGDTSAALATLAPWRRQAEAKGWEDERLVVMVLQAVALQAHGEEDEAAQLLGDALALAEPGGFVRIFVDEGTPMARLLSEAAARGIMPGYSAKLLAAFEAEEQKGEDGSYLPPAPPAQPLAEPLSRRELEVLRLIAQGLSNREIGERLFLAVDTVKGHNRRIFGKLMVRRRTEAVAKARSLGISPTATKNNTPTNTEVSVRQHRAVAMLLAHGTTATKGTGRWQTISINPWSTRSGSRATWVPNGQTGSGA